MCKFGSLLHHYQIVFLLCTILLNVLVGYFVTAEGKILVEDIVKLGTASEAIDGDLSEDVKKTVKKTAQTP